MPKWEYSPAPESTDVVDIKSSYDLFIGGKWVAPASGQYLKTINPATEEVLSDIPIAGEQDVDAAVKAARAASKNVPARSQCSNR
jgi:aldehyde dehydrogenase (NAD+)